MELYCWADTDFWMSSVIEGRDVFVCRCEENMIHREKKHTFYDDNNRQKKKNIWGINLHMLISW